MRIKSNYIYFFILFFSSLKAQEIKSEETLFYQELLKDSLKMPPNELKAIKEIIERYKPKPSEKLSNEIDDFFIDVSKIEVYAYINRNDWNASDSNKFIKNITAKKMKININNQYIKNRIVLDKNQIDLMKNDLKKGKIFNPMKCYDPRHLIVFYNNENLIKGYIELCFSCNLTKSSSNTTHFEFCVFNLKPLFKKIGITYFDEEE